MVRKRTTVGRLAVEKKDTIKPKRYKSESFESFDEDFSVDLSRESFKKKQEEKEDENKREKRKKGNKLEQKKSKLNLNLKNADEFLKLTNSKSLRKNKA